MAAREQDKSRSCKFLKISLSVLVLAANIKIIIVLSWNSWSYLVT